jgi:hypothetical protein
VVLQADESSIGSLLAHPKIASVEFGDVAGAEGERWRSESRMRRAQDDASY